MVVVQFIALITNTLVVDSVKKKKKPQKIPLVDLYLLENILQNNASLRPEMLINLS